MIKIENLEVSGWEAAIRGMRNPMNSWEKSDSFIGCHKEGDCKNCCEWEQHNGCRGEDAEFVVGANDLDLMKRLAEGGSVHAKYRRMIMVTCDITAPLYWWKEYDTYKVGTVANSCSTMHKIHSKEITINDFSFDDCFVQVDESEVFAREMFMRHVEDCETMRKYYLMYAEKAKNEHFTEKERNHFKRVARRFWRRLIQMIPSSYNQRRTVQFSYENAAAMHNDRRNHKIDEWHGFCDTLEILPYADGIIYNIGG